MKAVVRDRYGPPDVLEVAEVDTPAAGPGDVLVRVHAASLNTADSDHLRGRPRVARVATGLRRLATGRVGLDVAGRVEKVGPGVRDLRPGDEVWADLFAHGHGSFAEYVCAPAAAFAPKPADTTFEDASSVPHSGILALQSLRAGGVIRAGDGVLVNGAGGCVGPFAVQIAKAFGAEVTAVDHEAKLGLLRAVGADHVVDYTREDVTANGRRYEIILDIAANRSVLRFRRCLQSGGRYVRIARTLTGFVAAAVVGGVFTWRPNDRADLDVLGGLLETGRVRPHVDRRYPLDEIADAFRYLEAGRARGKVVIAPAAASGRWRPQPDW